MRTSLPYLSMISLRVGPTLEQKGHWKSENSTIVTLASLGPSMGVHLASSTFWYCEGARALSPPAGFLVPAAISAAFLPCLASAMASSSTLGARGQPGSSFLHLAKLPCGQPQSQGVSL